MHGIKTAYSRGWVVPLTRPLPYQDPFQTYRKYYGETPTVFLDSAKYQNKTGAYSYICLDPVSSFQFLKGKDPLEKWKRLQKQWKREYSSRLPFFSGGAVGFLSYDLFRDLEKVRVRKKTISFPKMFLYFFRSVIVFDHKERKTIAVTNLFPGTDGSFEKALKEAEARLLSMEKKTAALSASAKRETAPFRIRRFRSSLSRGKFIRMVEKAKKYIRQGDIYQANLSQKFSFDFGGDPLAVYETLRRINPSPFSSFLDFGKIKVISSSPELLVRLRGKKCETRPIAGTRPVSLNKNRMNRIATQLLLSDKERAEHLMLLDLERNDLGRVCEYKSVRVNEMMTLEKYSHVIHIVSNVQGTLQKGKDSLDLLRAVFPGGTITGCPKIRCMEIIDELEREPRGLYTGSLGYLDFNGDMDWNIVIRTLVLEGKKGTFQVGAGIVHDSRPEKEYEETIHKAKALLKALGVRYGTFL